MSHQPVLLNEVIEHMAIKPNGKYVDCTFGRGGHSAEILKHLGKDGQLFAMDKDDTAIAAALENSVFQDARFSIIKGSFSTLYQHLEEKNWVGKVDGILMDIGVSSPQLDTPERGFSFLADGPLDMRMDNTQALNAADWINTADEQEIDRVLKEYGEERYHKRISHAIVLAREATAISTTKQLADIVSKAHPKWEKVKGKILKHPATRVFQAIRIFVNAELEELQKVLNSSVDILAPHGRLLVISFHSLEHRIVKEFIRIYSANNLPNLPNLLRHLPIREKDLAHSKIKRVNGPITAGEEELAHNPRARSATLRVMERTT